MLKSFPHIGDLPRPGYVWRMFHLSLHLVTFGSHLAHLVYRVHKGTHTDTQTHARTKTHIDLGSIIKEAKVRGRQLMITQNGYLFIYYN